MLVCAVKDRQTRRHKKRREGEKVRGEGGHGRGERERRNMMQDSFSTLLQPGPEKAAVTFWNGGHSITETSFSRMAKDTRVSFENPSPVPNKPSSNRSRPSRTTERQISYEETENCVNEMSESFPALSNKAHRLMRQVSESFNFRTIKVALILSVILNLLLGIPFGIFFGFWMSQKHEASLAAASSSNSISSSSSIGVPPGGSVLGQPPHKPYAEVDSCFPCSDMAKIYGPQYMSQVRVRSRNNMCCTNDHPFLRLSAESLHRKALQNEKGPPCPNTATDTASRVAAHLMLNVEQTKHNVAGSHLGHPQQNVLSWISTDKDGDRAFVTRGLKYDKGVITVSQAGRYHVYTHVTLSSNENALKDPEKIIVHSVSRKSKAKQMDTLLFAQVTLKQNEVKSTNIEGSFELEEGDVVSVYVSHPSLLKDRKPANIFGMFIL